MFFSTLFPIFLLAGAAVASPLEGRGLTAASAIEDVIITSAGNVTPGTATVVSAKSENRPLLYGGVTTSPNSGFHELAAAEVDYFVACTADNCSGSCYGYDLTQFASLTCYSLGLSYISFYISQPSNAGLTYGFYAASDQCALGYFLPVVNACYHGVDSTGAIQTLDSAYRS